jgi:hypothetical protein
MIGGAPSSSLVWMDIQAVDMGASLLSQVAGFLFGLTDLSFCNHGPVVRSGARRCWVCSQGCIARVLRAEEKRAERRSILGWWF